MIRQEYKVSYLEKKLLETKLEAEKLELELFKTIAAQYALKAELLNALLEDTLGEYYRHYGKGHLQILVADKWRPVKFRRIAIPKPGRYSTPPAATFSIVLPSGRVSISRILTIDIKNIQKGEIRIKPDDPHP